MKNLINVTCAIIIKDGNILVTQRSDIMKLPLKWEFPGGKLEVSETEQECIIREIKEELNLNIEIIGKLSCSVFDYGSFNINLIPFISNYKSGEIVLSEHKDFKWMKKSDLSSLDWAEADLPILKEFLSLYL
jgi:8-oxo-dGTP diphosphatase